MVRLRFSVSALEKQIHDLESMNALLWGHVSDLQAERLRSEEAAAKYKRRLEKLKKEKEAKYRGYDRTKELFQELLRTLALNAFNRKGYFEAYVKYTKDRRWDRTDGQDLDLVEFNLPAAVEGGLDDEETMPLDGKATTPGEKGGEAGAAEGSYRGEDPDV